MMKTSRKRHEGLQVEAVERRVLTEGVEKEALLLDRVPEGRGEMFWSYAWERDLER